MNTIFTIIVIATMWFLIIAFNYDNEIYAERRLCELSSGIPVKTYNDHYVCIDKQALINTGGGKP